LKRYLLVFLMISLLSGCGTFGSIFGKSKKKEAEPQDLFQKGVSLMDKGLYSDASEAFQELAEKYPFSKLAIEAELRYADSLFFKGAYEEAFEAYANFERLHPRDKSIPYVLYQMGMCHFKQMRGFDRDLEKAKDAKKAFERLIRQHPKSRYAVMAKEALTECFKALAYHEVYVGKFYFRSGKYEAALARFKEAIQQYPDVGQYNEALEFIAKSNEALSHGPQGQKIPWWNLPKKLIY